MNRQLLKKIWPETSRTAPFEADRPGLPPDWRGMASFLPVEPGLRHLRPAQRRWAWKRISVPADRRGLDLRQYAVTARLRRFFDDFNVRTLGDLDGLDYAQMSRFRNCGRVTVEELYVLVEEILQPPGAYLGQDI